MSAFAWLEEFVIKLNSKMYSNGLSEVILGNAIRKLGLPREELVIMTKVGFLVLSSGAVAHN